MIFSSTAATYGEPDKTPIEEEDPQIPTNVRYKSKRKAECLERILYVCPVCGKVQTMFSHKNMVKCSHCNLEVKYNEYLEFESNNPNFKFKYVEDWYKYQLDWIKQYEFKNEEDVIYTDDVTLFKVPQKGIPQEVMVGKIQMTKNKFIFVDDNEKCVEFNLSDILDATAQGKRKLCFYTNDETYQIKGDIRLNVIKYMHMYYHIKYLQGNNENYFLGI